MAEYGPNTQSEGGGYNEPDAGTGLDKASSKGQVTQNAQFDKTSDNPAANGGLYNDLGASKNCSYDASKQGDGGNAGEVLQGRRDKLTTNEAK